MFSVSHCQKQEQSSTVLAFIHSHDCGMHQLPIISQFEAPLKL